MIRPDALLNIARMQNEKTDRNVSAYKLPHDSMRALSSSMMVYPAISVAVETAKPQPAHWARFNQGPKIRFKRLPSRHNLQPPQHRNHALRPFLHGKPGASKRDPRSRVALLDLGHKHLDPEGGGLPR